jgi:Transcriptional regulators
MTHKVVTMRDVARHACVSISTVSQILNGNAHYVGTEKRERVRAAIQELNYHPNIIARSMVKGRTMTIGLVITEIENGLFAPVTGAVEQTLSGEGYHILLAHAPDVAREIEAIEMLRARQVDGIIFMSLSRCTPADHLTRLKDEGVPFVVINRPLEDPDINQIHFDDLGAGYQATSHLLKLGHTRVATISGPLNQKPILWSAHERHLGWQQAMEEQHIPLNPAWTVAGQYNHASGYQATQQLLANTWGTPAQPTAIFIANDEMAIGALRALHQAHIRIPQDMAIITIGDPSYAAYTTPALSTLTHPVPEAGHLAARLLIDWLGASTPVQPRNVQLSFSLSVRESCGANTETEVIH